MEVVPFVERSFVEESLAAYGPDVCWVTFVDGLQGIETEPGTKGKYTSSPLMHNSWSKTLIFSKGEAIIWLLQRPEMCHIHSLAPILQ